MKNTFRFFSAALALTLCVCCCPAVVGADDAPVLAELNCKSAIMVDVSNGKVLLEKNANERISPASITKIMTAILVMEALESGKLQYTDMVTASAEASKMGGSQIWLEVGEQMTVDELLRAMMVGSANDATYALAEAVAGTELAFVQMMNEKASLLGMADTHFMNAEGLDEEGHYTTAADVARMSRALLGHADIMKYSTIWMDSLRGGKTELVNTNKLVRFYEGITGLKTGTTGQAGNCLSASAKRGDMHVVAVIMGCSNNNDRYGGAQKMLDYAFANFASVRPADVTAEMSPVKVIRGEKQQVGVYADVAENVLVAKGQEGSLVYQASVAENVLAPVEQGQTIGSVQVLLNGEVVGEYAVKCAQTVEAMSLGKALWLFLRAFVTA